MAISVLLRAVLSRLASPYRQALRSSADLLICGLPLRQLAKRQGISSPNKASEQCLDPFPDAPILPSLTVTT